MKRLFALMQLAACLVLLAVPAAAQQRSHAVRGVVTDASGPVPGVNVVVAGSTSIGTMTTTDGSYSLPSVPVGSVLQFSFVGYTTVEVTVGAQELINVFMEEDTNLLEELVVIGYGTVRKSDVTGAVASVSGEEMTKTATSDPLSALQGRAAGVSIVTATGDPTASAQIKIRGTGTTNNTDPLFVVDGFPMSNIEFLSPNDISSIEILKDASATAIYGSRGANGVVMITTKQAKAQALRTRITAEYGITTPPRKPAMLTSDQYTEMTNLANANSGIPAMYDKTTGLATTDWFNEVMQNATYQNYNLNLAGGSEAVAENFSVNYYSNKGTVKSTGFNRINLTSNTQFKPFKWMTLRATLTGSFAKTLTLGSNGTNNGTVFLSSLIAPPNVPVWNDATNYYSGISVFRLANPAGVVYRNADGGSNQRNNLIGNFSADIKFLKYLTFTSRFGYRYHFTYGNGFSPIYMETSNIASGQNSVSRSTSYSKDWTWENILTFNRRWGKVHDLTVMGAMSARDFYQEDFNASRMDLPSEKPELRFLGAATNNTPSVGGSGSALGMLSYLGRINYSLLNRYLLTASFRADGSSRFVGKNKWGYFPSASFAWRISEEPFFQNVTAVNDAKFRIGWGQIGNERMSSYYPYQTNIGQKQYYIIGDSPTRVNGAAPSGLGNASLMWETSEQFNVGIDLALLNNRLTFTGDYFIRKTDNILLSESVPRTSGTSSITRNVGGMENRGVELTLGWKDDIGDFHYSIDGNVSFIKNNVTNLGKAGYLSSTFAYDYALIDFQGQFSGVVRSEPGHPFNQFYGYEFLGIFQDQAEIDAYTGPDGKPIMPDAKPGDSKFADIAGATDENGNPIPDGKINASDMTFIGNPNPAATYGINFNFGWKNFDLTMLWQGVQGIDIFNASKFYFVKFDGRQNVLGTAYKAGWSGKGSTNEVPITLAYSQDDARNQKNWWQSSMYVEDGSYLRLKNIQLGYTFKTNLSRGTTQNFRVYVAATNLVTITKYSGLDPEIPGQGIDRGQYPQPRTFLLGVNVNL